MSSFTTSQQSQQLQINEESSDAQTPNYYVVDGCRYTQAFPMKWAINHLPFTGPKNCLNCVWYGSYNGVFVGYCANCLQAYANIDGPRQRRGNITEMYYGLSIENLSMEELYNVFPYMILQESMQTLEDIGNSEWTRNGELSNLHIEELENRIAQESAMLALQEQEQKQEQALQ